MYINIVLYWIGFDYLHWHFSEDVHFSGNEYALYGIILHINCKIDSHTDSSYKKYNQFILFFTYLCFVPVRRPSDHPIELNTPTSPAHTHPTVFQKLLGIITYRLRGTT